MKSVYQLLGLAFIVAFAHAAEDDCTDSYSSTVCQSFLNNNEYRRKFRSIKKYCAHTFGLCDTTGDCQPGWTSFNGACYYMGSEKLNYREAIKYCSDHDGVLASLINDDENNNAKDIANRAAVSDFWIGVYQRKGRAVAVLDDSRLEQKISNFEFAKQSIKPLDYGVAVSASGVWNLRPIDEPRNFLCSRLARNFCAKRSCGKHAYCTFGGEEHVCKCADGYFGDPYIRCEAPCECSGIGDPHYNTFDNQMISFMGRCRYILSQSENENKNCAFQIEVQNEDRRKHAVSNVNVSWTRTVYFNFREKSIELRRDGRITVDGQFVEEFSNKDVTVKRLNNRETEIVPDAHCGIFYVRFDSTNVKVKLNKYLWRGKVNGICGDCDGDAQNDLRTRGGLDVSKMTNRYAQIGNSWRVQSARDSEECDDKNIEWPTCDKAVRTEIEGPGLCGAIKHSREFGPCARKHRRIASDIFGSCVLDNCVFKSSGMKTDKCAYLTELADFCRNQGFRMANWRKTFGCPMSCPLQSSYTYDVPDKEESCATRVGLVPADTVTEMTETTDKEGCVCVQGHVRSGGRCVQNCGCKDDKGAYRNKGTKWISEDCKTEYLCDGPGNILKKTIGCAANAECKKVEGAYACVCKTGFTGEGFSSCKDINECLKNPCDKLATCQNVPGSFKCTCRTGYEGDGISCCKDTDECALKTHKCGAHANCVNTIGSYECACQNGYRLRADRRSCENVNECKSKNVCPMLSQCKDLPGSYMCTCVPGFRDARLGSDKKNPICKDIDECAAKQYKCHPQAQCINTLGSYKCQCRPGYIGDGKHVCDDNNECLEDGKNSGICSQICENTVGSYKCKCKRGFKLVGSRKCEDIDECQDPNFKKQCHQHANCVNTLGSFQCDCKEGYRGEGRIECAPINKCEEEAPCGKYKDCFSTGPGKYVCKCKKGYVEKDGSCIDIDECSKKSVCHELADCDNSEGSYSCRCKPGTKGDGKARCDDIDECKLKKHNCDETSSFCKNLSPGFKCECKPGFRLTKDFKCEDIDECKSNYICRSNQVCQNTPGSYTCKCKKGFRQVGKRCIDLDECEVDTSNSCAGRTATCMNQVGSYSCKCVGNYTGDGRICTHNAKDCKLDPRTRKPNCKCGKGYMLTLDKSDCIDINECAFAKKPLCDKNARCFNLDGSYLCKCNEGYCGTGMPGECDDFDECAEGTHKCDKNAKCVNTPGSYACQCKPGYAGDGSVCRDVDECQTSDTNGCVNSDCQNTNGGYECLCHSGFKYDESDPTKRKCVDINECEGTHKCDLEVSTCKNLVGTYTCVCKSGYKKINKICENIDECKLGIDKCSPFAVCLDTPGSYRCACREGFVGNGRDCKNINECSLKNDCHQDAVCVDEIGSYSCRCKNGFRGSGRSCRQIDECAEKSHRCGANSQCEDTHGSYNCKCNKYYVGNGMAPNKCELDLVDECKKGTDSCNDETEVCVDLPKGYRCDCKAGYNREGDICEDINECKTSNSCGENAVCTNTRGSYKCSCQDGFEGDGKSCRDIDECKTDTHTCDTTTSTCRNTAGAFSCLCKKGFERNGDNRCRDINECTSDKHKCDKATTFCANKKGGYDCPCLSGYTTILTDLYKCQKVPGFGGKTKEEIEGSFYEDW